MTAFRILEGDVADKLREMPDGYFHACLTDPPYGLSDPRNARSATPRASSRLARRTAGFMGMAWDADIPSVSLWREVIRVLKPGAFTLVFGGTRTFHRLAINLELAGFAIRDTICWLYGSGWPKSLNLQKATGDDLWEGYGTALKPAWEPVFVASKPSPLNLTETARAYGTAGLSIDTCRIPVSDPEYERNCPGDRGHDENRRRRMTGFKQTAGSANLIGRWPANLILEEETAALLDQQSGELKSGENPTVRNSDKTRNVYGSFDGHECVAYRGNDSGGASRFFYCAKASSRERHLRDGTDITHPTMKPLALTEYLARLILPPHGGNLLVPFAGVASEVIGAMRAGWDEVVAIEIDREYCQIARHRIREDAPLLNEEVTLAS